MPRNATPNASFLERGFTLTARSPSDTFCAVWPSRAGSRGHVHRGDQLADFVVAGRVARRHQPAAGGVRDADRFLERTREAVHDQPISAASTALG
jgi:hypothetical protein